MSDYCEYVKKIHFSLWSFLFDGAYAKCYTLIEQPVAQPLKLDNFIFKREGDTQ